jgi:hypothetical protein
MEPVEVPPLREKATVNPPAVMLLLYESLALSVRTTEPPEATVGELTVS